VFKRKQTPSTVVGLELDPSYIAAAEVTVNGSITVKRGGVTPLRPGLLRDGEAQDAAGLAVALREFFAEHELPTRVRLGIANQRIVVRSLDLPVEPDPKALRAAVEAEAPDHIPMPMDEAVVDFQPLGVVATPQGPRSRVVIAAVRRDMVERLAHACREAGLQLEGIDLSAFAMVRALAPDAGEEALLYVNVAGLTNVAVANGTGCLFTRAASGGLDAMVHTLAERRGLIAEHAEQWLRHVGLLAPLEEVEGEAELVAAARAVLDEGVHQLADAVRNSLNFYRTQDGAESVNRALVTGPAIGIPGFTERLGELLNMPVEAVMVAVDAEQEGLDAGRLSVAAGLAVEDR